MSALMLAWMAEVGILSWRTVTRGRPEAAGGGQIPWPADIAATFVVYGALGVLGDLSPGAGGVAAATGWGIVLATVLNLFDPTSLARAQKTVAARPGSILPQQQGAQ